MSTHIDGIRIKKIRSPKPPERNTNQCNKATHDSQKREFLKALSSLGVGIFVWSILPKRASALMFGTPQTSITKPNQTVKDFYVVNKGATFIVSGPKIIGSDYPPQKSIQTQILINSYKNLGIPEENILWNVVGEANQ